MAKISSQSRKRLVVTPNRRKHILDGDKNGSGGHGPGRNKPGKSEFPPTLSDDDIIQGIETILNDAGLYPGGVIPRGGPPVAIIGYVKSVKTVVIADPAKGGVKTAYPAGVPRNT